MDIDALLEDLEAIDVGSSKPVSKEDSGINGSINNSGNNKNYSSTNNSTFGISGGYNFVPRPPDKEKSPTQTSVSNPKARFAVLPGSKSGVDTSHSNYNTNSISNSNNKFSDENNVSRSITSISNDNNSDNSDNISRSSSFGAVQPFSTPSSPTSDIVGDVESFDVPYLPSLRHEEEDIDSLLASIDGLSPTRKSLPSPDRTDQKLSSTRNFNSKSAGAAASISTSDIHSPTRNFSPSIVDDFDSPRASPESHSTTKSGGGGSVALPGLGHGASLSASSQQSLLTLSAKESPQTNHSNVNTEVIELNDYMFFRNSMAITTSGPDNSALIAGLVRDPEYCAYCCQCSCSSSGAEVDWETCKENVLPVKTGRSVAQLNNALNCAALNSSGGVLAVEKERVAAISAYERQIDSFLNRDEASRNNSELLDLFVNYFKFTRTEYPSNQDKALKVLEKCTLLLKDDEQMKSDLRFVKLWIEYADMVPTPNDVFSFMNSNKIGSQIALFWIAWAFIFEKVGNYKATDTVFQKGLSRKNLDNKDLLQSRYKQFQRRLARIMINSSSEGTLAETTASMAAASAPPASAPGRSGLGAGIGFSMSGFSNNNAHSFSQQVSGVQSTRGGAQPVSTPKSNFCIFDENNQTDRRANISGMSMINTNSLKSVVTENPHWTVLPTHKERIKENEIGVSKWNAGPLIPTVSDSDSMAISGNENMPRTDFGSSSIPSPFFSSVPNRTNMSATSHMQARFQAPAGFQIFTDGDSNNSNSNSTSEHREKQARIDTGSSMDTDLSLSTPSAPGLSARGALSEKHDAERIVTDPVGRHKTATAPILATSKVPLTSAPTSANSFPAPLSSSSSSMSSVFHTTTASMPAFSKTQDNAKAFSSSTREEDTMLMATLQEIGVQDGDDLTINTKIAKRNIDELFCNYSPDASAQRRAPILPSPQLFAKPQQRLGALPYSSNNPFESSGGGFRSGGLNDSTKMRGFEHSISSNKTIVQSKFDALMRDDGVDVSIIEKQNQSMQFINTPFQKPNNSKNSKGSTSSSMQFNIFCDME